jgi:RNA polymerase sigma factor (TIGR02999 family)
LLKRPPGSHLDVPDVPGSATWTGNSKEDISEGASSLEVTPMTEVTCILSAIEQGDPSAAEQLLPLVYDELRKLAAQKLAQEKPGQTLEATALVHEAYLRLVDVEKAQQWNSRGHFFAAAAEAMRRILIETVRRKKSQKHGGGLERKELDAVDLAVPQRLEDVLALDEALQKLAGHDKDAADVVRLRFFAGLPLPEVASLLNISPRTADRLWAYARAWLHEEIQRMEPS